MKLLRTPFALAILIIATTGTLFFAVGCLRYGSSDELFHRVQIELAHLQPHETFAPTPLPRAAAITIRETALVVTNRVSTSDLLLPTITPLPLLEITNIAPQSPISQSPDLQSPEIIPTQLHVAPLSAIELTGFHHEWQTWNNCGPATLSFYLSYYGSPLTQVQTGAHLRHHQDDKNVAPTELADFARQQGFVATLLVNGDTDLMRTFLSNGIPVLIETWLEEEQNDGMGHYRLLTGYDDAGQYWIAHDSYITRDLLNPDGAYRGIRLPYAETDSLWKVFNRTYLVVYPAAKEPLVRSIFGNARAEPTQSNKAAMERARADIANNPNDAYAWFNLGSMLMSFNDPAEATAAFDKAREIGLPWRMLWYQYEPFAAYYQMGRYDEVVALADATMRNVQTVEELYYWKGLALEALGNGEAARSQWQQALVYNSQYAPAQQALDENQ